MSQVLTTDQASRFETCEHLDPGMIAGMVQEAAERLDGFIEETPLLVSEALSSGGAQISVKDETGQRTGAYKIRGGGNKVMAVKEGGGKIVISASTGNLGKAVGEAATHEGMESLVVAPESSTEEKQEGIARTGARLILHGENFDEALGHALRLTEETGGQFVHPFADPLVVAGQGTIGLELLRQAPDMTHLVLPVGGGGLLAGVASVIKEHKENVHIVAAQLSGNSAFVDSLAAGQPLSNRPIDRRFEGLAVGTVDPFILKLAAQVVDSTLVLSDPDEAYKASYLFNKEHGRLFEPAGAVSPATARLVGHTASMIPGSSEVKVVAVGSGGNTTRVFPKWLNAKARRYGWDRPVDISALEA